MPASLLSRLPLALMLAVAAAALTACGGSGDGAAGAGAGEPVAVTAKDDSCRVADTSLDAGTVTFAVQNRGSKITEVYVYGQSGSGAYTKIVAEVENIGPGTGRDLTAKLTAGSYEIACKPGQTGDGIRQQITVTGGAGGGATATASASATGYDREVELTVDQSGLSGLDPASATQGERIELTLVNKLGQTRTLEVVSPSGDVSAEVEVPAGQDGEAIVEMSEPGDWTVTVEGGPKDLRQTLAVR